MNGYKNTKEITDECETQFLKLKERREEKERIEQEYHAAQEKKDKEEREQREAIEQERKDREYKEYKIAENHRKVGINVSFFIQICSFVALFIALNFKNGEVNISFGGIFFFIVLALIIFFLYGTAAESETTPLIANIIISIMILIIGSGIGGTSGISAIVSGLGTIVASITAFICADE
jgi:lipopolysaccharide export LptBFGC system permease protein LptF